MDGEKAYVIVDIPVFVPTTAGPMSAMASVPESGPVRGPAVALLPGMEAERVRIDALREIAHRLASGGQPVISFDYPGVGMSPSRALSREEIPAVMMQACDWFRRRTGLPDLALAGTCGGGRLALSIAAHDQSVRRIVAQGLPLRRRERKVRSKTRAGIAALDWVGPRVLGPLTQGSRVTYSQTEWNDELVEDLRSASANAAVHLVLGQEDAAYKDLRELQRVGDFPPDVMARIEVSVYEGESLNLLTSPDHQSWFSRLVVDDLSWKMPQDVRS